MRLAQKQRKVLAHPWAGEDLSLKIDVDDQTIWKSIVGL